MIRSDILTTIRKEIGHLRTEGKQERADALTAVTDYLAAHRWPSGREEQLEAAARAEAFAEAFAPFAQLGELVQDLHLIQHVFSEEQRFELWALVALAADGLVERLGNLCLRKGTR